MIRDRVRMDAYARAISHAVRPGSVVLDIGTGTGILALLAARAGARRVFAVEPSELIDVAEQTVAANGLEGVIECIQGRSTQIELPERADVIVSDMRGVLPLHTTHIPSIIDARARLLADGGVLIPRRDTLWACPAESPADYADRILSWDARPFDFDLHAGRSFAANSWWRSDATARPLAGPARLAELDYRAISSPSVKASASWRSERAGTLNGFVLWFDAELAPGVTFTNAPGAPKAIYGQALFPVAEPVELEADDEVSIDFTGSLIGGDYVFRWDSRVRDTSGTGAVKAQFTQSTFFSTPLTRNTLSRLDDLHTPVPNPDGEAVSFLLGHADGQTTLGALVGELRERFPARFRSVDDARDFVTDTTQRYCR